MFLVLAVSHVEVYGYSLPFKGGARGEAEVSDGMLPPAERQRDAMGCAPYKGMS